MDSMGRRIRERRKQLGITQQQLADAFGIARVSVTQWEGDSTAPERDKIPKLAEILNCEPDWLLTGRGARITEQLRNMQNGIVTSFDPDASDEHRGEDGHGYTREHWRPGMKGALPEIDVKLGAGEGMIGEVINIQVGKENVSGHRVVAEWVIPQDYLRSEARASPNQTIVMEVVGDSMFPTYTPGDRVIVDLAQNRFVADTVYAISDGLSEPQIKRLQRVMFSDPVQVKIISDNQNLETITVELDRLTIIGRICGHIARK